MSQARLRSLQDRHAAVHAEIEEREKRPAANHDATIPVLKRQKLQLKDEIGRIARPNGHEHAAA